jgi:hypothetical protein
MKTLDFLQAVWPTAGYYALATPFTPPGQTKPVYAHKTFSSVTAAAAAADKLKTTADVYFCVHSLREERVWNPKKLNYKTGEPGAFEVRSQGNMLAGRTLFFDLDVGPALGKYASQKAASLGLRAFITDAQMPKPFVSSSGSGLHAFWPLTESIPSADWVVLAHKLKALATHHHLLFDPARTTDTASVLRVPGTFNRKNPAAPRPVELLFSRANPTSPADMLKLLDDALIRAGLSTTPHVVAPRVRGTDLLGSNTTLVTGPPVSFPALVTACAQVRSVIAAKGAVSEPLWYAMLGLVRYCADGNKAAHYISKGHPSYDYDETEQKLIQLESKAVGPTTCEKIESVNPGGCDICPRKATVRSPLAATRQTELAPPPVAYVPVVVPDAPEVVIPAPPVPYMRLKTGAVAIEMGVKDMPDQVETIIILPYDFYPVRRSVDEVRGVETHIWCADLPRAGHTDIVVDADALYDPRKLATTLANKGVFPQGDSVNLLRAYMVAYINTLQAAADAEQTQTTLGWNDDYTAFVLPSKTLLCDGTAKPTNLGLAALRATQALHNAGNRDEQIDLLKFFNHPDYAANQFVICAALGAPIFFATGHHGVVINMSGPPGASKSTTLYTGAALWGDPLSFCINGTTRGATHNARDNRMAITANLPQLVDEITRMNPKDAADLAMGVTQSEGRIRLDTSGVERKQLHSNKSTIMVCTANTSLYTVLSGERADSTAESMRVFEIQLNLPRYHKKAEADDYMQALRKNYGHIGEMFVTHVVQNNVAVAERVRQVMRAFDEAGEIQSGERFWSAAAATALVACEIAGALGLLQYKPKVMWDWLLKHQLPSMRNTIVDQYTPPIGVLSEYMELANGNMLVLRHGSIRGHENIPNIVRQPEHGQLLARLEQDTGQMWVMKKSFKDYCQRYGHNFSRIVEALVSSKVITSKHDRKVLGAGTDYAKGQAWCLLVNMHHPDMMGEQMIPKNVGGKVLPFAAAS